MKTVQVNKSSKSYRFLTAIPEEHQIFGFIEYLPKPYVDSDAWYRKQLPKDTCSLRAALIKHFFKTVAALSFITAILSFISSSLLGMIVFAPLEILAGFNTTPSILSLLGFACWLFVIILLLGYLVHCISEWASSVKYRAKKKIKTPSVVKVLYTSLKEKVCFKIEYVKD